MSVDLSHSPPHDRSFSGTFADTCLCKLMNIYGFYWGFLQALQDSFVLVQACFKRFRQLGFRVEGSACRVLRPVKSSGFRDYGVGFGFRQTSTPDNFTSTLANPVPETI